MEPIQGNPRDYFSSHRERGMKQHTYTFQDIADAAGLALSTVRSQPKEALRSLQRVAVFITQRLNRRSRRVDDLKVLRAQFGAKLELWENRFPRFDLYRCGYSGCPQVLLYEGLCSACGGPSHPTLIFDPNDYVAVYLGGLYLPWHRLVLTAPVGSDTHHHDGNKWNNRLDNLEVLAHADHFQKHHEPLTPEKPCLTMPNPYDTVEASKQHTVAAMAVAGA